MDTDVKTMAQEGSKSSGDRLYFIVGNSRSGTTMMMRIINNHSLLHALSELHFFEQLWSPSDAGKAISSEAAFKLADRLLFVSREGYLTPLEPGKYGDEARKLVDGMFETSGKSAEVFGQDVFREVAFLETRLNGKTIPCEKTPQNVFYIKEILELYPEAKILNMVRDPRGVLLSQKRKWKRRKMGAGFISRKEQIRLRINYHPITMSRLWNSSMGAAMKFKDHPSVHTVNFEKIMDDGETTIRKICDFFEVPFEERMLQIPHLGSSNEADDPSKFGIKKGRAGNWMQGGLNDSEIWFCQQICGKYMKPLNYEAVDVSPGFLNKVGYYISFPVKLALALLVNLNRMKDITETIKRRLVG